MPQYRDLYNVSHKQCYVFVCTFLHIFITLPLTPIRTKQFCQSSFSQSLLLSPQSQIGLLEAAHRTEQSNREMLAKPNLSIDSFKLKCKQSYHRFANIEWPFNCPTRTFNCKISATDVMIQKLCHTSFAVKIVSLNFNFLDQNGACFNKLVRCLVQEKLTCAEIHQFQLITLSFQKQIIIFGEFDPWHFFQVFIRWQNSAFKL